MMDSLTQLLANERAMGFVNAGIVLVLGWLLARLASRAVPQLLPRDERQRRFLVGRGVFYLVLGITFITALHQLGVNLTALLGAAGILTVAIGFASQTSASNLISGLFLLGEGSIQVGDVIVVGEVTGEVLSVDLLSVKIRTFDNVVVRVPNENLIKSNVTNNTRLPIRRYDLLLSVAYKEDLKRVFSVLEGAAAANPLCLVEPKPLVIFLGFGESGIDLQLSVWARREKFLDLRNSIALGVKAALDRENIEIPFPHRSLYAGSDTPPIPVTLVTKPTEPKD